MKEKLVEHVEKGVFAACALLLLFFMYSAFSHETYNRTPENFQDATKSARSNVTSTKVTEKDLQTPNLAKAADLLESKIDPQPYAFRREWRRPFDYGLSFRKQPKILKPSKPEVQSNRGLFAVYKVDLATGQLAVRKVKRSSKEASSTGSGRLAPSADRRTIGLAQLGQQDWSAWARSARKEADVNEVIFGNEQMGRLLGAVPTPDVSIDAKPDAAPRPAAARAEGFRRRVILKGEPPDKEKKAAAGKAADEEVEELIVGMVGKHFVEIVAAFPHAEQIREYVRALNEPASFVGLYYAFTDVERQEFLGGDQWSEWKPIDIKEQFDIVLRSAYGMEPEPFPDVVIKGLAMNIPFLLSLYREFLTMPQFESPRMATYEPEYENPRSKLRRRPSSARSKRREHARKMISQEVAAAAALFARNPTAVNLAPVEKKDDKPAADLSNHHLTETAMIRFWDFTVAPGRRYRYRLRVNVYNPNFARPDVADAEFAKDKYLEGDWSDPSDGVYVEPDVQWYATGDRDRGDRATLEVHYWSREVGEWLVNQFRHRAGDLIGLGAGSKPNVIRVWDENANEMRVENLDPGRHFDASAVLLDVWGGREKVGDSNRTLSVPVEVVAVNAYGDLIRKDSETDASDPVRSAIADAYQSFVAELTGAGDTEKTEEDANPRRR